MFILIIGRLYQIWSKTAMIIYKWYIFEISVIDTVLIYIQLTNIAKLFNKNNITFYNYFEQYSYYVYINYMVL